MQISTFKKFAISTMAAAVLLSGASSAFARGNDDHDNDKKDKDDKKNSSNITINVNFKDEDDMKWAQEYIIRLASKGVLNGYGDGTFKPNQKISRIETIVAAVRLMGLREQAESAAEMSSNLNFKDADQLKKKYPWAVGYVAVALENDLFSETEDSIQPEKPATRLWSATILVKALKLEAEAKAASNTKLTFKDAKQIPAGSVGYVAVALQKGIITGYNDNTFRPNQQVTRAELAALLDRTDSQLPDQDNTAVTGTLKAAVSNNSITVVQADKSEKTLAIDPSVFVFRDNKKAALTDLKAGDEVLVRTYNGNVIFIEVTKLAQEAPTSETISGTLKASASNNSIVVVKADKTESTLTIDSKAIILRNNKKAALADLKAGDEVLVRTNNGKVIYIEVTKPAQEAPTSETITGTLKASASNNSIVVVKADKTESTLTIDSKVIVLRDNKKAALKDLKAGDEVTVRTYNGNVIYIEVTKLAQEAPTTETINGTLKAAVSNNSIVIVKADKTESTLPIDPTVIVLRDNKKAALTDLKAGDEAVVRTFNGKVIFIEVKKNAATTPTSETINGTLKAAVANNSVVVVKADKSESTLTIDPTVIVLRDNKKAALTDLKAGDEVVVRTLNGNVIYIEVTKLAQPTPATDTVTGTLKAAVSNNSIVVVEANNTEYTLAIDPSVIVFREDKKAALTDLKAGDEVIVRTLNNKVIFVEVTKLASVVVGAVDSVSLNAQGKTTISITGTVNGALQAYVINVADVVISGDASKLVKGQAVELTLINGVVKIITIK
ncbi:hypothetical protein PCCS19_41730 [Paenibacillus sp. CCS19]|uniref:S-layer homology domain-containing protein n=1 Tax=Paenibacillus sp. CCS19 TaxID=3158387 RepID=UPI002567F4E4|nr:S-layer homology domain-containing protein [Paenibacillus cellulosilyticus]GMK41117.1 hypothetical protein PCCS19_41730 [Paenibacillus cellulosilyticus]